MDIEIPKEHQLKCEGCGKIIDMRNLSQVLSHGWIENGKIVCYDEEPIEYSGSKKCNESVLWSKDMKAIYLS